MKDYLISYNYETIHLGKPFITISNHKPIIKARNIRIAIKKFLELYKEVKLKDVVCVEELI